MAPLINNGHVKCEGIYANKRTQKSLKTCSICSQKGHQAKCCPEVKCYYCGRLGHTQKLCWFKLANKTVNYQRTIKNINHGNSSNSYKKLDWFRKGVEEANLQVTNMEISFLNSLKKDYSQKCKSSLDVSKFCISLISGDAIQNKDTTDPTGEPKIKRNKKSTVKDTQKKLIINLEKNNNFDEYKTEIDFNQLKLCRNKERTVSHIDLEVMGSKLVKHFVPYQMQVEHPYNLSCLLFGLVDKERNELEGMKIDNEMLELIINKCSGTFYIYVPEKAEEIRISPRNKKSTFNVFCIYFKKEFGALEPKSESLIANYNDRINCGNEIASWFDKIGDDNNNSDWGSIGEEDEEEGESN